MFQRLAKPYRVIAIDCREPAPECRFAYLMMLLFAAQLGVQLVATPQSDTAQYTSPAVRQIVTAAALANHLVPAALGQYRATVESEISFGMQNVMGSEGVVSIEQTANELLWKRTGEFEQHVTGYRNQSLGFQLSSLGFFQNAWTVPSLYGNRLALLFGRDTTRIPVRRVANRRTTYAVHPLADDRERYYRFSGGDTVQALMVGNREIRIVKLEIQPRADIKPGVTIFTGELDLDADRMHVVRMRGAFQAISEPEPALRRLLSITSKIEAIAYVELVNAEVNQQFWLPSYQRFDFQALVPLAGDGKTVFRIVSQFRNYDITAPEAANLSAADTLRAVPHRLTMATGDSLAAFGSWRGTIGSITGNVSAEDFSDVAPLKWRTTGPPVWAVQGERFSDLVRANRVEGLFTGLGVSLRARDAVPGLTAHSTAGYAWSERTVRGRVSADLQRGTWTYGFRAGRSLDNTNDFAFALDSTGSPIGTVFGVDKFDYVDRLFAHGTVSRTTGDRRLRARLELGYADDRPATQHLTRGLFGKSEFLPNRPVNPGGYARTALILDWNPNVAAEFLRPGIGGTLTYRRGDGAVNYQRAELRLSARANPGRWTLASRFDAGALFGAGRPLQQLFELGSTQNLPGYDYKQFAGDQAALLRGIVMYRLNIWQAPIQLSERFWLPALAPGLSVTGQTGWAGSSGREARSAISRLAFGSAITGEAKTSAAAGIRLFGGAVGIMAARAVDHKAPWRVHLEFGQIF